MSGPFLEVRQLAVSYQAVAALRGVSLHAGEREVVAVLGPNGAGKSTLLNAVVGLVTPRAGEVRLDGEVLTGRSPDQVARRGVGVVPEGRRIFGRLSVEENLRVCPVGSRRRRHEQREVVYALFPALAERSRQLGRYLSGGQQQQLAIGRALMAAPRLLLLDEPSLGLAPAAVEAVFETIGRLREAGVTVVVVEQRVHQTLAIADRAYVLSAGTIRLETTAGGPDADRAIEAAYFGEAHPAGAGG
ncbi:MAG: ABC transporter ATP-binding protein [Nocardioidaceae bacterium]|nr:ABC transporter ATP-binding protein [Nocardioidaceae bacterium]